MKEILCDFLVDLYGNALDKGAAMLRKGPFWLFCAKA
jgi:hypothetical protein